MADKVIQLRPKLTADAALSIIRAAMQQTGEYLAWGEHVWEQMVERGILHRQVLTVLEVGELKSGPTWNDEFEDWVCVLNKFVSGRSVSVVVGIDGNAVTIVTAY